MMQSDSSGLCHYGVGIQMLKSDSSGVSLRCGNAEAEQKQQWCVLL